MSVLVNRSPRSDQHDYGAAPLERSPAPIGIGLARWAVWLASWAIVFGVIAWAYLRGAP